MKNIDTSFLLKRWESDKIQTNKVREMYKIKHILFDYIHHRIRSLGKSHTSRKLGWYKKCWGDEINRYYSKFEGKIKLDLDRIIIDLNKEYYRVKALRNRDFKTMFSHKKPRINY